MCVALAELLKAVGHRSKLPPTEVEVKEGARARELEWEQKGDQAGEVPLG